MIKGSQAKLKPLRERMEKYIARKPNGCWEWTAFRTSLGYGKVRAGGHAPRFGPLLLAHRAMWEMTNGPIPAGLCVLHQCDNPPCVNPSHLRLGTKAENSREAVERGLMPRGNDRWNAKLTPKLVRQIRAAAGSQREIATHLGVSQQTVSKVRRGLSWGWVA